MCLPERSWRLSDKCGPLYLLVCEARRYSLSVAHCPTILLLIPHLPPLMSHNNPIFTSSNFQLVLGLCLFCQFPCLFATLLLHGCAPFGLSNISREAIPLHADCGCAASTVANTFSIFESTFGGTRPTCHCAVRKPHTPVGEYIISGSREVHRRLWRP